MKLRFSCSAVLAIVVSPLAMTVCAVAQSGTSGQVQVSPPLARHIDAPSPEASAEDLERKGDQMRGDKAFLDALDYLRAALAKSPKRAALLNKIGIVQLQLARYPDARKSFEAAIRIDRGYADAHNNLGVDYYLQESAKEAAKLHSGSPLSALTAGDFGRAIKEYRKAIKLQEDSASFHSNLGAAYFARKDFEKAVAAYARAMELDPDVFDHTSRIGVAAQTSSPGDRARYFYLLASLFAKSGATDRALSYLQRAMEDGYKDINKVFRDEDFAVVRNDPRFTALMNHKPAAITE